MECEPTEFTYENVSKVFAKIKGELQIDHATLSIIPESRYEEACMIFLGHLIPDEPLANAFHTEWNPEYKEIILKMLRKNMSVMVVSKDTDEIMGIQITKAMKKSDDNQVILSQISYEPFRDMLTFLAHKDDEVIFYEKFNVDEAFYLFALCVHRKFRRMGLGTKLIGACVALGRELGFKVVKAEGTSNYSHRIFIKYGFENLCEMPYDTYIYKGKPIRERTREHTMTKVFALRI